MLLDITRTQELEMPNEVTVAHANTANAYQKGSQQHRRRSGHSSQSTEIELAIAMSPERALKCARVILYAAVAARNVVKWTTNMRYSKLKPSNVVRIDADGLNVRVCIKEANYSQGLMEFVGETDNARVYEQEGVAAVGVVESPFAGTKASNIAASIVKVYDLPRLEQNDPTPVAYASLMVTDGTFTGCNLYIQKPAGGFRDPIVASRPSTCGIALRALAAPPSADVEAIDEVSTVDVEIGRGQTLSSCTRAQMLAGANMALIGNDSMGYEILHFQDADLIAEDTYRLSNLYRSRKDTVNASKKHLKYDDFLLLSTAIRIPLLATDIGVERLLYAVTIGSSTADAFGTSFTITDGGSILRDPSAKPKITARGAVLDEGDRTDDRRPLISGLGTPGEYAGVFSNASGEEVARVLIGETGTWSHSLAADLADGVYAAAYRYVRAGPVGPILSGMSPSFAYEIAPASGSASYQYWRIHVTANNGGTYLGIDQFEFFDADDVKHDIPYGNWSSNGSLGDFTYGPEYAFNVPTRGFVATFTGNNWVQGWFNEPKDIAYVTVSQYYAFEGGQPIDFEIQGSTDGVEWTTVKSIVGAEVLTSGSQRVNF